MTILIQTRMTMGNDKSDDQVGWSKELSCSCWSLPQVADNHFMSALKYLTDKYFSTDQHFYQPQSNFESISHQ